MFEMGTGVAPPPLPPELLVGDLSPIHRLARVRALRTQALNPQELRIIHTPHQAIYLDNCKKGIKSTSIKEYKHRNNCNGQAARLISTARLNVSPHLHLQPINLVVSEEPSGIL